MAELSTEQRFYMERTVAGMASVSDKIRALNQAGYPRGDIARFLGKRYQHVRNVLVHAEKREEAASQVDASRLSRQEWAQVGPDGRFVIPAAYRRFLGIEGGGPILMLVDDGELRLVGRDAAVKRAQELVARYMPAGASLADELIAERRSEVSREGP